VNGVRGSSVELAKALGSGAPAEMGILVIQHGWKNVDFMGIQ